MIRLETATAAISDCSCFCCCCYCCWPHPSFYSSRRPRSCMASGH